MSEFRVSPHSEEAEDAVVGACLSNNDRALTEAFNILKPEDFYSPKHEIIFEAIQYVHNSLEPVDIVSVSNYLESKGVLSKIGGSAYLSTMSDKVPASSSVGYYAKIVRYKADLRFAERQFKELIEDVYEYQNDYEKVSGLTQAALFKILQRNSGDDDYRSFRDVAKERLNELVEISKSDRKLSGFSTGFNDYDEKTGGLRKGGVTVLAARPAMGKTTLAINLAVNIVKFNNDAAVGVFELEMADMEVVDRVIAGLSRVPLQSIINPKRLSDMQWQYLTDAAYKDMPDRLFISDRPGVSVEWICNKMAFLNQKHGCNVFIVDHLQLVNTDVWYSPAQRVAQLDYITQMFKERAKEMKVHIIILSQLSRALETRTDKRPQLSDLRESGAIEQNADVVTALYRESYYIMQNGNLSQDEKRTKLVECGGRTEWNILKQRQGPTGTVNLTFLDELTKFEQGATIKQMDDYLDHNRDFTDGYRDPTGDN